MRSCTDVVRANPAARLDESIEMAKTASSEKIDRPVAAAERSLRILDAFAQAQHPLSLGELADATNLFKSVILRYMISFEKMAYVRKLPDGRYQLSIKALQLGKAFESSLDSRELILAALSRLRDTTGESVFFYVREGDNRMCIMGVDSPQSLRVNRKIGVLIPMDTTSISQVLREFETGAPASAGVDTAMTRNSIGAYDPLTCSISAPAFDRSGSLIGALVVSGPIGRFDATRMENLAEVAAEAQRLSALLGYTATPG
jgi:DNA-binding IclR family transcriptional regulator